MNDEVLQNLICNSNEDSYFLFLQWAIKRQPAILQINLFNFPKRSGLVKLFFMEHANNLPLMKFYWEMWPLSFYYSVFTNTLKLKPTHRTILAYRMHRRMSFLQLHVAAVVAAAAEKKQFASQILSQNRFMFDIIIFI